MKLQIISALIFLFFMILFSFVELQITPTQYGTQISFGQQLEPANLPETTTPTQAIAMGECYSTAGELTGQTNRAILAGFHQSPDQQLQQLETIIEKITTTSIRQQHPGTVYTSVNLP